VILRKLTKQGNSVVLAFPRALLEMLNWDRGTTLEVKYENGGIRLDANKKENPNLFLGVQPAKK
jgi:antitoxin component of MazEF toxin-antitoxin module